MRSNSGRRSPSSGSATTRRATWGTTDRMRREDRGEHRASDTRKRSGATPPGVRPAVCADRRPLPAPDLRRCGQVHHLVRREHRTDRTGTGHLIVREHVAVGVEGTRVVRFTSASTSGDGVQQLTEHGSTLASWPSLRQGFRPTAPVSHRSRRAARRAGERPGFPTGHRPGCGHSSARPTTTPSPLTAPPCTRR